MSVPEAAILTLPLDAITQGARKTSETDTSWAEGADAVTDTTPWSDFVTWTEHLPV